jgi:small subunit ribosomal protein S4e
MVKNHIKRINAPKRWDILRKEHKFISKPNPGRNLDLAISLNTALKEMLSKTNTTKESKYLIKHKGVLVNGVRRYDEKFPVGFLDVLTLPELSEHYRLVVDDQGKLTFLKITEAESKIKISKVAGKALQKEGKIQLNCTDGRNFIVDQKDAEKISTNDTVVYTLPEQKMKETIKLEKGCLVFLYKGKHIGRVVKSLDFRGSTMIFKADDETLETKKSYAFAVGKDKQEITLTHQMKENNQKETLHQEKKSKK